MRQSRKVLLAVVGVAALGAIIYGSIYYSQQGIVTVQTGRVMRQDLVSRVTASGEIKPHTYINIGATGAGRTEIFVQEGDRVKKGQLLAKVETVQPEADVNAQRAAIRTAQSDLIAATAAIKSMDENLRTVTASLDRAKAERERARLNFERARQLFTDQLISRQEFDARKAEHDATQAAVTEAEARISQAGAQREQAIAQRESAAQRIEQFQASLTRASDVLQKHFFNAPIDGVVTNLPVRSGETVVFMSAFASSVLMTIADMSRITAEVLVDETDIVNVKLGQSAEVTIDAIANRAFHGRVTEIGNTAILRSSGRATSQTTVATQEARDFKVVVVLDNPPAEIRPGLSCTAKITTATRERALTIPIQALTIRTAADLEPRRKQPSIAAAADKTPSAATADPKQEIQGVFVVDGGKCYFKKVATGITGASDIEVLDGLREAEEIITGSYKILRTIRPATAIEVDNRAARRDEKEGS
jgi:HlyD family secretion protein